MELRNIHIAAAADAPAAIAPEPEPVVRLRTVTVSPHEEYARRDGKTAPIPNELASLICALTGRVEITTKGVCVDRVDIGKRFYWHPDSPACNDLSYRSRKILYAVNRQAPDIVHLMDETGRYLETLPEKNTPGVLCQGEQAVELEGHKRQIKRMAEHLNRTHGKDTERVLEEARANRGELERITKTLPAPVSSEATAPVSPLGNRIAQGERRIEDRRKLLSSARSFGRIVSLEAAHVDRTPAAAVTEDWSDAPAAPVREALPVVSTSRNPQPTKHESW